MGLDAYRSSTSTLHKDPATAKSGLPDLTGLLKKTNFQSTVFTNRNSSRVATGQDPSMLAGGANPTPTHPAEDKSGTAKQSGSLPVVPLLIGAAVLYYLMR